MNQLSDHLQSADWKSEKHVPVIECPDQVAKDQLFQVKVSLGKEIPHPNTTEHHIAWIALYFQAASDKFTHEVGYFRFSSHGESVKGANQGPVYTQHEVVATLKVNEPGQLFAQAYCNIHGLWQGAKELKVQ